MPKMSHKSLIFTQQTEFFYEGIVTIDECH